MLENLFKGTGPITKLILKQNRFKIVAWLLSLVIVTLAVASAYPGVYKSEQDIMAYALTMDNPAMIAMLGPGYDAADYNTASIFANEMLIFTLIAVAVMNILLVSRATRADEEDGQMELVRALSVGKLSYLSSSLIMAVMLNGILTVLVGASLSLLNLEGMDLEGTFLYGAILGVTGLTFAGFTALFAQLSETSRGATGFSFAAMITFYLIRAIGDTGQEGLSLVSPLGWAVRTDVFVENHWWPVLLLLLLLVVLIGLTFYLNSIRDMGAGFLPERKGKIHASTFLQTPVGLAFRLQRTNIIAWGIGVFVLSASFGSILGELETYFADMEILQVYLQGDSGTSMRDSFISLLMGIMSMIASIPVVMTIIKVRSEESKYQTELIYSRAVSRNKLLGSYLGLAIITSFLMQTFIATGLWSVGSWVLTDELDTGTIFLSAYVYLPAIWFLVALTTLLIGLKPKITGLTWFYVVYCFLIIYVGDLFDLPEWVKNLSVFHFVPYMPLDDFVWSSTIAITIGSVIVSIMGVIGYNKRDIIG